MSPPHNPGLQRPSGPGHTVAWVPSTVRTSLAKAPSFRAAVPQPPPPCPSPPPAHSLSPVPMSVRPPCHGLTPIPTVRALFFSRPCPLPRVRAPSFSQPGGRPHGLSASILRVGRTRHCHHKDSQPGHQTVDWRGPAEDKLLPSTCPPESRGLWGRPAEAGKAPCEHRRLVCQPEP